MALPSRYGIEKKINSMEGMSAYENGGKGSGNFGHSGRPGLRGGSGDGGGGVDSISKEAQENYREVVSEDYGRVREALGEISGHKGGTPETESRLRKIEEGVRELRDTLKEMQDAKVSDKDAAYKVMDLAGKVQDKAGEVLSIAGSDFNFSNWKSVIESFDSYVGDVEDFLLNSLQNRWLNGGKGSGNFGHSGRPGERGGSGSGGVSGRDFDKELKELDREGVPFTSPRYQAVWQDMQKAEKAKEDESRYDIKDGKEARKYLTADGNVQFSTPEAFGFTYDSLGKPTRLSRFEKSADDKLWSAWASMQKVQDDMSIGDVTKEGLASAGDALRLAKAVISTSQTAYLPSERSAAERQTKDFVKGVKDSVKKAKTSLTADTKKYGDTAVRKATRKALDKISSAMDGFLGYENPTREYKD